MLDIWRLASRGTADWAGGDLGRARSETGRAFSYVAERPRQGIRSPQCAPVPPAEGQNVPGTGSGVTRLPPGQKFPPLLTR